MARHTQSPQDGPCQDRFSRPQFARKRDDVARAQAAGDARAQLRRHGFIGQRQERLESGHGSGCNLRGWAAQRGS